MLKYNIFINRFLLNNQLIEITWTFIPAIILIFIALPSINLLYLIDEINFPSITIKSTGHQWYWRYEYPEFKLLKEFNSFLIPINEIKSNNFRLLDVDNRLIIPIKIKIRLLITTTDVIHSWTIPSMGIKVDGIPGRLNQLNFLINRPGLFFGQCSEICGINHRFIPIVIESIKVNYFIKWIIKN